MKLYLLNYIYLKILFEFPNYISHYLDVCNYVFQIVPKCLKASFLLSLAFYTLF